MSALSLAIIGKNNEPLYMKEFREAGLSEEMYDERILFGLSTAPSEKEGNSSKMTLGGFDCSSRHQFILHSALDRFEQLVGPPPGYGWRQATGAAGTDGMFVGLLTPIEELRVYGYSTTTRIKLIIVVEDESRPDIQKNVDEEIKLLLVKIHDLYVADLMNPFKDIGTPIASKRFEDGLQKHVSAFNQNDGMI